MHPMQPDVTFGDYRFDVESRRLWSGSREIRLTPKASDVLKVLVTRAGEPVSKEDFFAAVWTDTVVSDDALTSCIQELRRAFEDDAKQPRFIETRHRRGYRFVAPLAVAVNEKPSSASVVAPAMAEVSAIAVLLFVDMSATRSAPPRARHPFGKEDALDYLERVFARGWDILRDPQFKTLLARIK